ISSSRIPFAMLKLSTATSKAKEDILCQNCLQYGHWSYECKNPPKNASRMSRMQKVRSKKYQPKFNEDPGPDVPKNNFLYDNKRFGERKDEVKPMVAQGPKTNKKEDRKGRSKMRDEKRSRRRARSESSSSSSSSASSSSSSDSESGSDSSSGSGSSDSSGSDSSRSPSRSRRRSKGGSPQQRRQERSSSKTGRESGDLDAWRRARDDAQAGPRQRHIERPPPERRDDRSRENPRREKSLSPPGPRRSRRDESGSPKRRRRENGSGVPGRTTTTGRRISDGGWRPAVD
ncbi:hypothetical protein FOZ62_001025, partial [Perkinsus olseni]